MTFDVLERTGLSPSARSAQAQAVSALLLCTLQLSYMVKTPCSELRTSYLPHSHDLHLQVVVITVISQAYYEC